MNTLSWLLYAGDVIGRFIVICGLLGSSFLMASLIAWGIFFKYVGEIKPLLQHTRVGLVSLDHWLQSNTQSTRRKNVKAFVLARTAASWARTFTLLGLVFLFLAVFSPSPRTIYMIAASEMGEEVVKSPAAQQMFDMLQTKIKSYLEVENK